MPVRDRPTLSPPRRESAAGHALETRLTAQQASLIKAFAVGDPGFLNRSYYLDHRTRRRTAYRLQAHELSHFVAAWAMEPVASIRFLNDALARLEDPSRVGRYLDAVVDLERLMDRASFPGNDERIYRGIPSYFMDGYTDMGSFATLTARPGREKIRIAKYDMRPKLLEARRLAVVMGASPEDLLARYYDAVRHDLAFDDPSVTSLSREWGDSSISLSRYFERGVGVCRHLAITIQLYLQEAGIASRVVKGNLRLFGLNGRHAWNLAFVFGQVALIDATLPGRGNPFIVMGASQEDVYRRAAEGDRSYLPTPDIQNHYKISLADQAEPRAVKTG